MSSLMNCLLCCLVLLSPCASAADFQALTENLPPLNYEEDGKVQGYASDVLRLTLQEAGLTADFQVLPWARAYKTAQTQPRTILYSLVRTPEREALFQWVGPFSKRRIFLYRLSQRQDIKLSKLDDAKRFRVGATRESATAKLLLAQGFTLDTHLDQVDNDELNLRKLSAGRFDLLASLDWALYYNMRQQHLPEGSIVPALLIDDTHEYYFGVSLGTPAAQVRQLQEALDRLKRDGQLDKLTQRYLPAQKSPP